MSGSSGSSSATVATILEAAERLGDSEMQEFVTGALALRARREAPVLSELESALLLKINEGLPKPLAQRLFELTAKRDRECLTPEEHEEITRLGDEVERRDVERLEALTRLAAKRKVSLSALMVDLGLHAAGSDA